MVLAGSRPTAVDYRQAAFLPSRRREDQSGQQLARLTSLRAFAALAVFFYHGARWGVKALPGGLSGVGYAGVTFFFILSGFVLAWGTRPGLPARVFYWRRFARIWPSHITMLLVVTVVPVVAVARTWKIAGVNALLLQGWFVHQDRVVYGMNGVSWSLSCEALFYACFPIAVFVLAKLPRPISWSFCLLVLVAEFWISTSHPFESYHLPLLRLPEFLLGLLAGLEFRRGWRPEVPFPVALVLVLLGIGVSLRLPLPLADAALALPFLCLLMAAANRDLAGKRGWLTSRWLIFAGEASFAFYLVHEVVIVNLREHLTSHHTINLAILLVVAATAAVVLHLAVEKPCNGILRRVPIGRARMAR